MKKYRVLVIALSVVAVLIAGVATTVLAASKFGVTGVAAPTDADYQAWGCPVMNGDYGAVASLLGMTTQEIYQELQAGKSLAEIAASKGVSEDKLVAAIIDPMKQFMQQQVTAGYWTQAQVDARLNFAEQHIRQLVNTKGGFTNAGGCGGFGMMGGWGTTNGGPANGSGGMMGGWGTTNGGPANGSGGMMGGWGTNNGGSTYGRGGMMGGGWGGMMGGGGRTY